ncbi:hypothetical protein Tco_0532886 [Tanacetum coccineum]
MAYILCYNSFDRHSQAWLGLGRYGGTEKDLKGRCNISTRAAVRVVQGVVGDCVNGEGSRVRVKLENKCNNLKDFLNVAGPMGVAHFLMPSKTVVLTPSVTPLSWSVELKATPHTYKGLQRIVKFHLIGLTMSKG